MKPTLTLIVPVYDEEVRLPGFLEAVGTASAELAAAGAELVEVLIVDDGSTDQTPAILQGLNDDVPTVRACRADAHRGKGAAVALGLRAARGELALISDVDLSTPLGEARHLLAAIQEGADAAIGSRSLQGARVRRSVYRRITSRSFNLFTRALTGLRFRDTQCGFKVIRTEVGRRLVAEQLVSGYCFDVEMLMRARAAGLVVREVPVVWNQDHRSNLRPGSAAIGMARDTVRVAWRLRMRRSQRPRRKAADVPAGRGGSAT